MPCGTRDERSHHIIGVDSALNVLIVCITLPKCKNHNIHNCMGQAHKLSYTQSLHMACRYALVHMNGSFQYNDIVDCHHTCHVELMMKDAK